MRRDYSKKTMAEAELVAENYLKERYQNIKSVEIEITLIAEQIAE